MGTARQACSTFKNKKRVAKKRDPLQRVPSRLYGYVPLDLPAYVPPVHPRQADMDAYRVLKRAP